MAATVEKPFSNGTLAGANVQRAPSTATQQSRPQTLERISSVQSDFSEVSVVSRTWKESRVRVTRELEDVDDAFLQGITVDSFMEYVSSERLTNMPHRGGPWHMALKAAEYFALQLAAHHELIHKFARDSEHSLRFALACCRLLLDV